MSDDMDRTMSRDELSRLMDGRAASQSSEVAPVVTVVINGDLRHLLTGRMVVGRAPVESDAVGVRIDTDPLISKEHVALEMVAGRPHVMDLGSSNGSTIQTSGEPVELTAHEWVPVAPGDRVVFGDSTIAVEIDETTDESAQSGSNAIIGGDSVGDRLWGPATGAQKTEVGGAAAVQPPPAPSSTPPIASSSPVLPTTGTPVASKAVSEVTGSQSTPPGSSALGTSPSVPASDGPECVSCHRDLPPGSRFCDVCGAAQSAVGASPTSGGAGGDAWAATTPDPQPDPADDADSSKLGKRVLIGAASVVVIGGAAFAAFTLLGGDDSSTLASGDLPKAPANIEERWSEGLDAISDVEASSETVYVATTDDGEGEITALARLDGEEQWSVEVANDISNLSIEGILGGSVVVEYCASDTDDFECAVVALAVSDGEEIWDEDLDSGNKGSFVADGSLYINEFDGGSLESIDAADGSTIEKLRDLYRVVPGGFAITLDDDEAEVFSMGAFVPVFAPVDVGDDVRTLGYDGSHLLVSETDGDAEIIAYDEEGEEAFTVELKGDGVSQIVPVDPGLWIVGLSDEVVAIRPADGRVDDEWSEDGFLSELVMTDAGPRVLIIDDDEVKVIDPRSGDEILNFDGAARSLSARDALIVAEYDFDSAETDVAAYSWSDGEERWEDKIDGRADFAEGLLIGYTFEDVTVFR